MDDVSGTGQWRAIWPINILWPILKSDEQITISKNFPPDPNFFAVQNTIMRSPDTGHPLLDNLVLRPI